MDLRSTLNLPDADFTIPMKADLPQREPGILARWQEIGLYELIQRSRAGAPEYILHDGPPYTNSPIHLGTAMNKILKDFVVKFRTMMGYRAPFVPGYDNHGLPIEQAVMRQFAERQENPDPVTFRRACRAHAQKYIDIQSEQFQRLAVFGMWDRPYTTMDYRYEAEIVRVFKRLVQEGVVYRGLRPTLWSPTSRTALADTEIVYQDHTSRAIYVRFPLRHDKNGFSGGRKNLYTVIWTTTPWTIPGNVAVAFHPNLEYVIVEVGDEHYVLLGDLVEATAQKVGWTDYRVVETLLGVSFEGSTFSHPIYDRESVAVLADYITTEDGTGVVHTAPGHGREDFMTGAKYGLPVLCPVDDRGVLTAEAPGFEGVFFKDGDVRVVEKLRETGNLLADYDYFHSYPYAERDGKPVIFRATEQWFVGLDIGGLRERMLEQIDRVRWIPENGRARIEAMVRNRPDWCISRQRPWGVGIPVLFGAESGEPVLDPDIIENVAQKIEALGSDCWFDLPAEAFVPEGYAHPKTGETAFRKETDVLDVWFDSGATSLCVLEGNVESRWKERWPADLYLEGSDQHRGWFNSSLVIATAVKGEAPYRSVVTHGFIVDESGRKMSKRLGNVIEPIEASSKYGADVLRYWAASVDWTDDAPCGDNLLKQFGESYRRIRNTIRFLLANLYDDEPEYDAVSLDLDRWVVEQTDLLAADVVKAYEAFDFGAGLTAIHNFCVNELSAFYLDAIKDRMYCDGKRWDSRRSGQAACRYVLGVLVRLLAPILPFTAEEVYAKIPMKPGARLESVHLETFIVPGEERLREITENPLQRRFGQMLDTRGWVFSEFEKWKTVSGVKDPNDVVATISHSEEVVHNLTTFGDDLPVLLKMSAVELKVGPIGVEFAASPYAKCERSRLRRPDVAEVGGRMLSARDRKVLEELGQI